MNNSSWPSTSDFHAARSQAWSCSNFSLGKSRAPPFDVLVAGHPAEGRLLAGGPAPRAIDDPLQDPHILAESRHRYSPLSSLRNQFTWKILGVSESLRCMRIQWRK